MTPAVHAFLLSFALTDTDWDLDNSIQALNSPTADVNYIFKANTQDILMSNQDIEPTWFSKSNSNELFSIQNENAHVQEDAFQKLLDDGEAGSFKEPTLEERMKTSFILKK